MSSSEKSGSGGGFAGAQHTIPPPKTSGAATGKFSTNCFNYVGQQIFTVLNFFVYLYYDFEKLGERVSQFLSNNFYCRIFDSCLNSEYFLAWPFWREVDT